MRARRQVSLFLSITLFLLAKVVVQSTAGLAVPTWGDPAFACADPRLTRGGSAP